MSDMSSGGFDPGAVDPFDDGGLLPPATYDDEVGAELPDAGHDLGQDSVDEGQDHAAFAAGGLDAPDSLVDDDAIEALFGGPLEITPDPSADAELEQWLQEPAPNSPTHSELADLDRLLKARMAQE